nr:zf-CCHC domain-containing protein/DUF4219 domain-containing protein/UBN2 domain-containing protein [Tanacetum cinerariifolium]
MMKEMPYELLEDDEKIKFGKNNEAKTLYKARPHKEYERVFMCKTAKEVWHTLIITHQENDGVVSKNTKEKVKSLAHEAKVTRKKTSDNGDSQEGSDDVENEDEDFNLMARNALEFKDKSTFVTIKRKRVTSLVSVRSLRITRLLEKELGVIVNMTMNLKRTQHVSWKLTLKSKINELKLEVKKLNKAKEVVELCQKFKVLTHEVDSLKSNFSKLQDEALNFLKFKKSSIVLDDMRSRQKLSQDKKGLGFSNNEKILP